MGDILNKQPIQVLHIRVFFTDYIVFPQCKILSTMYDVSHLFISLHLSFPLSKCTYFYFEITISTEPKKLLYGVKNRLEELVWMGTPEEKVMYFQCYLYLKIVK